MIAEAWESYRKAVVPADAGPVQVEECRRAFYGGASALYFGVMGALSPGQESTPADERVVEGIADELTLFAEATAPKRGNA